MTLSPATPIDPLMGTRLPPRRGGNLARVPHSRAGHFLFLQTPQNVGADGTDVPEPSVRLASPEGQGWAGAAHIGWVPTTRAKSLPLLSLQAQVNHFAHFPKHSAVGATKSVRRMIKDARKFSPIFRKSFREAGNVG